MKILYICTHNRCRSILSEAITNHIAHPDIQAFSAGSQPAGEVHPLTIQYLKEKSINTNGLKSQSWNDFEDVQPDIVITVCDSAANESCPTWFGNAIKLHWGLPDPSKLDGTQEEIRDAFYAAMNTIEQRVNQLVALKITEIPKQERPIILKKLIESA